MIRAQFYGEAGAPMSSIPIPGAFSLNAIVAIGRMFAIERGAKSYRIFQCYPNVPETDTPLTDIIYV